MTRDEFIDDIQCMDDLYTFCCDNNLYDYFEDYYDYDGIENYIDECYYDGVVQNCGWREAGRILSNLENEVDSYSWFYIGDGGIEGISPAGDYFYDLKSDILDYLDHDGFWDDEEEEDTTFDDTRDQRNGFVYEEPEPSEPEEIEEEEIPLLEVINDSLKVQAIKPAGCNKRETDDIPIILF